MDAINPIEQSLRDAVDSITVSPCPSQLAGALRYTLFPGGARVRPKLVIAVASACSDALPPMAAQAAVAIEFLHCASLVQDDLKCFDNAAMRRGKPSVHVAFDERLAILASDALIVSAFDVVANVHLADAQLRLDMISLLSRRVGSVNGIAAGQAWECEEFIDTDAYHQAKTGSLFAAATQAGALSTGADMTPWARTGECIGAAYQIADDLQDVLGCAKAMGKPVNVDATHGRPNAVQDLGAAGALARLKGLIEEVIDTVPPCMNANRFIDTIRQEAMCFLPKEIARSAA